MGMESRDGIYDNNNDNDEADESVIDNNKEDEVDAELHLESRTIKTLSFCSIICIYYKSIYLKYKYNNSTNNKIIQLKSSPAIARQTGPVPTALVYPVVHYL